MHGVGNLPADSGGHCSSRARTFINKVLTGRLVKGSISRLLMGRVVSRRAKLRSFKSIRGVLGRELLSGRVGRNSVDVGGPLLFRRFVSSPFSGSGIR